MDGSFCQRFFQRQRDLVRAGGVLAAAGKALEAPDGVLRPEPREQGADAFQVAVAAAHDCNGFDDAVVCERLCSCACTSLFRLQENFTFPEPHGKRAFALHARLTLSFIVAQCRRRYNEWTHKGNAAVKFS